MADDVSTTWSTHVPGDIFSPSAQLDSITVDVANLAASARRHTELSPYIRSSLSTNTEDILQKAQDIQTQLLEWSTTVSPSWIPIRVPEESISPTIRTAGLYQDYCHVYPSISIASTWNKYHLALIRTQLIVLSQIPHLPPSQSNLSLHTTTQISIQKMADYICASIPFTLGDKIKPSSMGDRKVNYPHAPGREVPDTHYQMATALGGFWLLAPLQTLIEVDEGMMREGQKQ